jgi:hypothetical protein
MAKLILEGERILKVKNLVVQSALRYHMEYTDEIAKNLTNDEVLKLLDGEYDIIMIESADKKQMEVVDFVGGFKRFVHVVPTTYNEYRIIMLVKSNAFVLNDKFRNVCYIMSSFDESIATKAIEILTTIRYIGRINFDIARKLQEDKELIEDLAYDYKWNENMYYVLKKWQKNVINEEDYPRIRVFMRLAELKFKSIEKIMKRVNIYDAPVDVLEIIIKFHQERKILNAAEKKDWSFIRMFNKMYKVVEGV